MDKFLNQLTSLDFERPSSSKRHCDEEENDTVLTPKYKRLYRGRICIDCNLIFGTKKSDIIRHSESQRHIRSVSSLKNVTKLKFRPDSEIVKMPCHNLSFRSIDHLYQLPSFIMNDSKISQQISLKRIKCIKLIKNVLASVVEDNIVIETVPQQPQEQHGPRRRPTSILNF
ncbi:hypothetical protein QTP88_019409 [Uroleucon formosanum]